MPLVTCAAGRPRRERDGRTPADERGAARADARPARWRSLSSARARPSRSSAVDDRAIPGPAGMIPVRVYTPVDTGARAPRDRLPPRRRVGVHGHRHPRLHLPAARQGVGCGRRERRVPARARAPVSRPPLDDCYAATTWVVDHAADFGVDGPRASRSRATARVATCRRPVTLRARAAGEPALVAQVLVYPVTDAVVRHRVVRRRTARAMLLEETVDAVVLGPVPRPGRRPRRRVRVGAPRAPTSRTCHPRSSSPPSSTRCATRARRTATGSTASTSRPPSPATTASSTASSACARSSPRPTGPWPRSRPSCAARSAPAECGSKVVAKDAARPSRIAVESPMNVCVRSWHGRCPSATQAARRPRRHRQPGDGTGWMRSGQAGRNHTGHHRAICRAARRAISGCGPRLAPAGLLGPRDAGSLVVLQLVDEPTVPGERSLRAHGLG